MQFGRKKNQTDCEPWGQFQDSRGMGKQELSIGKYRNKLLFTHRIGGTDTAMFPREIFRCFSRIQLRVQKSMRNAVAAGGFTSESSSSHSDLDHHTGVIAVRVSVLGEIY